MRPIRDIIVKVPQAYKTNIKTRGGLVLELHQSLKQVKDTIRFGEVIAVPEGCRWDIKEGDTLFFHHNIVGITQMEDKAGGDMKSHALIDEKGGLYKIGVDYNWPSAYARVRDGELKTLDGVCFVKQKTTKKYDTSIFIPNNEQDYKNVCTMVYPDEYMKSCGVVDGTDVILEKDSEYEFHIGDDKFYRVFSRWILAIHED